MVASAKEAEGQVSETSIMHEIMVRLSQASCRVFRNNVGVAKYRDAHGKTHRVRYGLFPGSHDLIGWTTIVIGPEHVGCKVAVFTSVEAKTKRGRLTVPQRIFLKAVQEAGGIAGEARSADEAEELVGLWQPKP